MKRVLYLKLINIDGCANSEKRKPIFISFLSLNYYYIRFT